MYFFYQIDAIFKWFLGQDTILNGILFDDSANRSKLLIKRTHIYYKAQWQWPDRLWKFVFKTYPSDYSCSLSLTRIQKDIMWWFSLFFLKCCSFAGRQSIAPSLAYFSFFFKILWCTFSHQILMVDLFSLRCVFKNARLLISRLKNQHHTFPFLFRV
jgi:hypothetical protein